MCINNCVDVALGISQKKVVEFNVLSREGLKVKAQNNDLSKVAYIETDILDIPELDIIDIVFPKKIRYEDEFSQVIAHHHHSILSLL